MKMINKLRKLVELGDFFHSSQMLRFRGEDEYRTLTGGIISLGIIITIIIGFFQMIMNTLNLSSISFTQNVIKKDNPQLTTIVTSSDHDFMFGIEIWRLNLSSEVRYFDVVAQFHYYEAGVPVDINMTLVPCSVQHWASIPEVIRNFDSLEISGWLCPPIGFSFNLFGKYSSDSYQELGFIVSHCTNESDLSRPCASEQEIDKFFDQRDDWCYFTYYFVNTVINPDQTKFKTYYLQDEEFVIFGKSMGVEAFLYFTDYKITTDYSIFPFGEYSVDSGFLAEETVRKNCYTVTKNNAYVEFNIAKSSRSLIYQREVQKISTVFSFMGGLIGALMAVMFIVNSYTSFSYEISIALDVFSNSQKDVFEGIHDFKSSDGSETSKKVITFFDFLKYSIYDLSKFLSRKLDWPDMEHIHACRKEILNQLDIKSIVKRLVFLEYSLTYLFEDYQLEGLQLRKPTSPDEIKRIRQKIQMVTHDSEDDSDGSSVSNHPQEAENQLQKAIDNELIPHSVSTIQMVVERYPKNEFVSLFRRRSKKEVCMKRTNCHDPHKQMTKQCSVSHEVPMRIDKKKRHLIDKRNSNLSILKDAAEKGDSVSRRIWHKLTLEEDKIPSSHFKQARVQIPVEWTDHFP